jgi:protein-S-isoprenylcysteine O-methyltransferase Ste14
VNDELAYRTVLLAGLLIFTPIGVYHRLQARTGEKLDRRQEGWFILIGLRLIAGLAMAGLIGWLISPASVAWAAVPLPDWLRWTGAVLGGIAGALFTWTFRCLGRNLTDTVVTRKEHTLVTTGPYRWVRHPFYTSAALAILANSLLTANGFIFVTGGLIFVLLAVRTPKEEANLMARFGDDYRQYMKSTGRFVPRW